jgi:peptide/nickel transport system substrate-binding protein
MKRQLFFSMLVIVLVTTSLFASCTTESSTVVSSSTVELPNSTSQVPVTTSTITSTTTQANWWDTMGQPQYGGTMTLQTSSHNPIWDPWVSGIGTTLYMYENMVTYDWSLDRKIWPMNTPFVPTKYYMGLLAESWEYTDPQILVFHLRQGIHWQNKEPLNGREFTADDIVEHYHRIFGDGSGYTLPSGTSSQLSLVDSVTSTDQYTVAFKLKSPSMLALYQIFDTGNVNAIEAPELARMTNVGNVGESAYGLNDWHNVVGTSPWMLEDYVSGSAITFNKNPDYWGYDERHPDNKLPYIDTMKVLIIPDTSTALAAVRTGKVDYTDSSGVTWQQASSLAQTNPDIQQSTVPAYGPSIDFRVDKEPFTDINVRKALNMSIDRQTIAESFYGGTVDGTPCGMFLSTLKEYCYPYNDWSQEDKNGYSFNPTEAKKLLTEAGYPDGFETNIVASTQKDVNFLQLVKSYLGDIGVHAEIKTMDPPTTFSYIAGMKHDQMAYFGYPGTATQNPLNAIYFRSSKKGSINPTANHDSEYDALVAKVESAVTEDDLSQTLRTIDKYIIEHYWTIYVVPSVSYILYQPYVVGVATAGSGGGSGGTTFAMVAARWWIDDSLKNQ